MANPSENYKRSGEKERDKHNHGDFALDRRKPKQRGNPKQLRNCKNASDPKERTESRDHRKSTEGHREQPGYKIRRQAGPWYEPACEQCERTVLVEPYLT